VKKWDSNIYVERTAWDLYAEAVGLLRNPFMHLALIYTYALACNASQGTYRGLSTSTKSTYIKAYNVV